MKKAWATALPVSPEVATRIWMRRSSLLQQMLHGRRKELRAKVLECARGAMEQLEQQDAVIKPAEDRRKRECPGHDSVHLILCELRGQDPRKGPTGKLFKGSGFVKA